MTLALQVSLVAPCYFSLLNKFKRIGLPASLLCPSLLSDTQRTKSRCCCALSVPLASGMPGGHDALSSAFFNVFIPSPSVLPFTSGLKPPCGSWKTCRLFFFLSVGRQEKAKGGSARQLSDVRGREGCWNGRMEGRVWRGGRRRSKVVTRPNALLKGPNQFGGLFLLAVTTRRAV